MKNNIQKLVALQLKLKNGQDLWNAFLHLYKNFSFKFVFDANTEFGANVALKKYDSDEKVFYFNVSCNKYFFEENLSDSEEEILKKDMIYRPCLIKLNGFYHLSEQELLFFITLAHEFLHVLNQLERIQKIKTEKQKEYDELTKSSLAENQLYDTLNQKLTIQNFLKNKLNLSETDLCLKEEYKKLWQNGTNDDSLDEMTVILSSNRQTEKGIVNIGETTFLREYFKNDKIISWSHFSAHSSKFWKDVIILLEKNYIEAMQKTFSVIENVEDFTISEEIETKQQIILNIGFGLEQFSNFFNFLREEALNIRENCVIKINLDINLKATGFKKQPEYWQFAVYPQLKKKNIKILPLFSKLKFDDFPKFAQVNFNLLDYEVVDVPADGNCAFTSVKVAQGDKEFTGEKQPIQNLSKSQQEIIKKLRNDTANEMAKKVTDCPNFIAMLRQLGFWNNGIEGGVGIEVLSFVAQIIEQPILVLTQEPNGNYRYWISGTMENQRDGDLTFYKIINYKNVEQFLNAKSNAIKLFHNGIHFQAIVKKDFLPAINMLKGTPSLPIPPIPNFE
ncbi:MAG: hypothetical protein ACLRFH_03955 [Opitutales bacterium]